MTPLFFVALIPLLLVLPIDVSVNAQLPFLPSGNLTHLQPATNLTATGNLTNSKSNLTAAPATSSSNLLSKVIAALPPLKQGSCKAHHDYVAQLAVSSGTANGGGYNGAPPPVNYSHVYSSGQANLRDDFAQGYNYYFGISLNYTQTHDIIGIKMINYQTPDGVMFEKEAPIFKNGTEVIIPAQSIGDVEIDSSAAFMSLCS
jgi:hypothetical protein